MTAGIVTDPDPPGTGRSVFNSNAVEPLTEHSNATHISLPCDYLRQNPIPAFWDIFPFPFNFPIPLLIQSAWGQRIKRILQRNSVSCDRMFIPHHLLLWAKPSALQAEIIPYIHDIAPVTTTFSSFDFALINERCVERVAECDLIVCASNATERELRQRTEFDGETRVIYQGVEPQKTEYGESNRDIDLLYVGSLHPRKDRAFLERTIQIAQDAGYSCKAANYKQLNLPCETKTNLEKAELEQLYRKSRFYIHPSVLEGFGRTPVEAQAHGTIPLARDFPINHEILGDEGKSWLQIDKPEDIIGYLSREVDQQMRESAQRNTSKYNWETTLKELSQILFNE